MARPIRETPILFGKDAARFTREMKRVENIAAEQRNSYHEKLMREVAEFEKNGMLLIMHLENVNHVCQFEKTLANKTI